MPTSHGKATLEQTKIHNTRLVLRTIYDSKTISRAGIARVTKLTRPTVSDAVTRLIEEGLVTEVGRGASTGGKQPTLLSMVDDARTLIGVDLSGNSVFRGALVDLQGKILYRTSVPIENATGAAALERVFALVDELIAQATTPLLGMGIGSPGLIDAKNGIVRRAVNLGWEDLPLRDLLAQRYPEPIYVANDSHITALGEYSFGTREASNLIVIKIGRGIGAGIVIHGDLFYGDGYGAGEIGHVVVNEHGDLCTCGNAGCLETVAAIPAILRKAQMIADTQPDSQLAGVPVVWETLVGAFHAGDPYVAELVTEVGRFLGISIANLIGGSNIFHIVFSGHIADFGSLLLDTITAEARRRVLPSMAAETVLGYASFGVDIGVLGSAAMLLKNELGVK